MNEPQVLINSTISIPFESLEKVLNSTCKILIENIEKGIGFFLKFQNQFKFEINLLITSYSIISKDFIDSERTITIISEDNKNYELSLKSNERIIKYIEKYNITLIEIKDSDIFKSNSNFLLCDLNYFDITYHYENQNVFIYLYHSKPLSGEITKINELKKFTINIKEEINEYYYGSPIISNETSRVLGIYSGYNDKYKFGIFIRELQYSFLNSQQIKELGFKFNINYLIKFSKLICQVESSTNYKDAGFFIKTSKNFCLLITSSQAIPKSIILSEGYIKIISNSKKYFIELKRDDSKRIIKYLDNLNITVVQILDEDKIKDNVEFFPIINEELYNKYLDSDIFILQYLNDNVVCSSGKITKVKNDKKYEFNHSIKIKNNTYWFYPIISAENLNIIGINSRHNIGRFMKILVNNLKNLFNESNTLNEKSKGNMGVFKMVYKKDEGTKTRIFGDRFVENNKNNCFINVNGEKRELSTYIDNSEILDERFVIELIETKKMTDLSNMFDSCSSLTYLPNISNWNMENVTNISCMFFECSNLKFEKDKLNWNISNCTDIRSLFYKCSSANYLPDISNLNTSNVIHMNQLFGECYSLKSLPNISKWDTSNVKNANRMFFHCSSLIEIPDISKWNTKNMTDLSFLFFYCSSLKELPDISKWNTSNVEDISALFSGCTSLLKLPDISKWDTNKVSSMENLFMRCQSIKSLPNISKWKTSNVTSMSEIFHSCESLEKLPDISKWNTSKVIYMQYMFSRCYSLISFPEISLWDTSQVVNMRNMFSECYTIKTLPDISKWNTSNVEDMNSMFMRCYELISVPEISKWNNKSIKDISNMFRNCIKLKTIAEEISKWAVPLSTKQEDVYDEQLKLKLKKDAFGREYFSLTKTKESIPFFNSVEDYLLESLNYK